MRSRIHRPAAACLLGAAVLLASAQACPAGPPNLLKQAIWRFSTDGGRTFRSSLPRAGRGAHITAKAEFTVSGPSFFDRTKKLTFVSLQLTVETPGTWTALLNGNRVQPPVEGVNYRTVHGISPKWVRRGENQLTLNVAISGRGGRSKGKSDTWRPRVVLSPLQAADLKFHSGPILGPAGEDFFTLTCRTNLPAEVDLRLETSGAGAPVVKTSGPGLLHRFRVAGMDAPWSRYKLTARHGSYRIYTGVQAGTRTDDPPGAMRFIAAGDSRTNPAKWAAVASAIAKAGPEFVVFSGDMVTDGRNDWEWNEQFIGPARDLLAGVPLYAVIGNHEQNSPMFDKMFTAPAGDEPGRNWSQTIRYLQIIGIDGAQDFSRGGRNAQWLDRTLAGSKARFVFLFTHYPAWTSSSHGKLGSDGRPHEKAVRQAQEVILPLLVKHKATAMIAGHDHCYERSAPPGGVAHIITGGAGAPLRDKASGARRQNPHSRVYAAVLHYCMFDLNGDVCTLRVLTPQGRVIDEQTWEYRGAPPRPKAGGKAPGAAPRPDRQTPP